MDLFGFTLFKEKINPTDTVQKYIINILYTIISWL